MEESVKIVRIETDSAVNSIKSLQNEVDALKAKLKELKEGTAEYEQTLNQISSAEEKLGAAMNGVFDKAINTVADLKTQISELKDVFATLNSGTEEYKNTIDALTQAETKLNTITNGANLNVNTSDGVNNINTLKTSIDSLNETFKGISEFVKSTDIQPILDIFKQVTDTIKTVKDQIDEIDLGEVVDAVTKEFEELGKVSLDELIDSISEVVQASGGLDNIVPKEPAVTVKGLKEEIVSLRDALLNTEKGSEEYRNILEQLIADQQKLTEVMAAGKTQISAATGSYNALVNQMSALKKAWRETTDEATRKDLGKQIKDINDKLKGFDESIGDFRRNVGNYTQSITAAFSSMGGAAKGMIGPINGVKTAFNALSTHPLIAVFTGLAALLINGLVKGFQSSEEATNKLKVAFSGFKAIGDVVLKIFQGLALGIANLGNAIVNLLDKWGLLPESFKERQKIAEDEIKLTKKQRDNITKNADLEKEIAKLRADSADKNKYTAQQRLDFLEQAMKKEEEIAKNEYEALEQEYNIIVAKNALAKSNAVDKDAEAKAYAAKIAAETKYLEKKRSNNKEISRINKEMVRDAQQAELSMLNLQKDLIQQEYDLAEDGSEEQLNLAKELRKKELEIQQEGFKTKIKNRSDFEAAMKMSVKAFNNDIANLEANALRNAVNRERELSQRRLNALREGSVEYYKDLKTTEERIHNLYKTIVDANGDLSQIGELGLLEGLPKDFTSTLEGKTLEEFKTLESESFKALKTISDNLTRAKEEQAETLNQIILNGTRPMSAYYREQAKQLREYLGDIRQMVGETDEEFEKRKDETITILPMSEESPEDFEKRVQEVRKKYVDAIVNEIRAIQDEADLANNFALKPFNWNNNATQFFLQESPLRKLVKQNEVDKEALKLSYVGIGQYIEKMADDIAKSVDGYSIDKKSLLKGFEITPENIKALFEGNEEVLKENVKYFADTYESAMNNAFVDGFDMDVAKDVATEKLNQAISDIRDRLIEMLGVSGDIPEELLTSYLDSLQTFVDSEKEIVRQSVSTWTNWAQTIAQLCGSVADAYEAELKYQVKRDKMSEEAAKDEFDTVKGLRIAMAIIDTIQGSISAFMGWQDKGQPQGAIMGTIAAASVAAAGWAQIRQIQMTEFGGSGSGGASGVPMASVAPVMMDYQPQMTGTVTGEQETEELVNAITKTPIWVSVKDIDDAQERGRVRTQESTF